MDNETEVGPHGCIDCYLMNGEFTEKEDEEKLGCSECGGTVLGLQELLDTLADRDSEIRQLQDLHESWELGDDDEDELDDET